jgi:outer membrane protein assembly factor BamE (lipoprotein component of BamABCDE complex)
MRRRLLLALLLVALVGCATSGRRFPTDQIPHIEPGLTTSDEIRAWFGEPIAVRSRGTGGSTWRYDFREGETADTGTASRVGGFLSSIFGGPRVGSPVNVAYGNETRHRLVVYMDPDGVVGDYEYERSEKPTKRVY